MYMYTKKQSDKNTIEANESKLWNYFIDYIQSE